MMEDLREIGRAKPVFMVGDSHTLIFDGRIYRLPGSGDVLAVKSNYIPGITAQQVSPAEGSISAEIYEALRRLDIITPSGQPKYTLLDKHEVLISMAHGSAQTPPLCVFHIGEINVRQQLCRSLGTDFDIVLPQGLSPYKSPPAEGDRQIIPFKVFSQNINTIFEGLFRGIELIRQAGLKRIFLHSMPVPYSADETFAAQHEFALDKARRIKVSLAVNAILARQCQERDIGFINIWGHITDDTGILQPRFELDGFHLSADACAVTMNSFLDCVRNSQAKVTNGPRYDTALDRAAVESHERTEDAPAAGYQVLGCPGLRDLPAKDLAPSEDSLFADIDWAYRPDGVESGLEWLSPGQDFIDRLAALLFADEGVGPSLATAARGRPVIYSARPFRTETGAVAFDEWAHGAWPTGMMRAVAVIDAPPDSDGLHLLVRPHNEAADTTSLICPPGSLIVYDPRQVRLTSDGGTSCLGIDLHFGPAVPEMRPKVIWNGRNCWPGDPFVFSLHKAVVSPRQSRPYVALLAVPYWEDRPAISWHQTAEDDA